MVLQIEQGVIWQLVLNEDRKFSFFLSNDSEITSWLCIHQLIAGHWESSRLRQD